MANYATLKSAIQAVIKTNGNEEITGALLQQSLLAMIDSLGAGYQFVGVAEPSTNPGTPDQKVFYIAVDAGTYSNFGSTVLTVGQIGFFSYNGTWTYTVKTILQIIDNLITNDATKALSAAQGKFIKDNLDQLGQKVNAVQDVMGISRIISIAPPLCSNPGYIQTNGTVNSNSNYGYSDPIEIQVGDKLHIQYVGSSIPFYVVCSSDGTFIETGERGASWDDSLTKTFTEACYIRVNGRIYRDSGQYLVAGYIYNDSTSLQDVKRDIKRYVLSGTVRQTDTDKVTINAVRIGDGTGADTTFYADNVDHEDVEFTFGELGLILVATSSNTIQQRWNITDLHDDDFLLLAYSTSAHKFVGGALYPWLGASSLESLGSAVDTLEEQVASLASPSVEIDTHLETGYIRATDGVVSSQSTTWLRTGYVDIEKYYAISYTQACLTSASTDYGMAFYDKDKNFIRGIRNAVNAAQRDGQQKSVIVPIGAKYAAFTYWNSSYIGDSPAFSLVGYRDEYRKALATSLVHGSITSQGQLNAIKRARQLTDITWTPLFEIPRYCACEGDDEETYPSTNVHYEGKFLPGKQYKGLPYGRAYGTDWGYGTFMIGCDISLETFVTAIRNPRSVVAVESAYSLASHTASKYSLVCAALVSYAYGLPYTFTADMPSVDGMSLVGKLNDNGDLLPLESIRIGDLIHTFDHCAIITDIITNDDLEVSAIEICEGTSVGEPSVPSEETEGGLRGGVTRRKGWTAAQMYSVWGAFSIYRYGKIAKIGYTPSAYVQVGDEVDLQGVMDLPLLPYMGEGFAYKAGYIHNSKLLIDSDEFNAVRVKKDGANWKYDGTTDYYDVTGLTELSVQFSATGNYSAYLCKLEGGVEVLRSKSCHWSVI